jgi:uncharacterized cupredoxin-like copper-binding protein
MRTFRKKLLLLALLALCIGLASFPASADSTVIVTPSDTIPSCVSPSITFNKWCKANVRPAGSVDITTTQPRDTKGSLEFNSNGTIAGSPTPDKADFEILFNDPSFTLGNLTDLSFEWYRDPSSLVAAHLFPAFRLYYTTPGADNDFSTLIDNQSGYLIWEGVYNGIASAPTGSWQLSDILAGNFWMRAFSPGRTIDDYNVSLAEWMANTDEEGSPIDDNADTDVPHVLSADTRVTGLSIGVGSGWGNIFKGFVDNATVGFNGDATTYNFEPDPTCDGSLLCYVDDNGNDANSGLTPATAKKTIQAGIDAVAAGGEVRVLPGNYDEKATNRFVLGVNGPHQFGLFVGGDKDGISIIGVTAADVAITSASSVEAFITTNATNNFGASGVFVEGDDVTMTGLQFENNKPSNNKVIEVIGDNFMLIDSVLNAASGAVYLNDWQFDAVNNVSHVKSYNVSENIFNNNTSLAITSGAGFSGPVANRLVKDNIFSDQTASIYLARVSFNGQGGVPWFTYPVGGAIVSGNDFGFNAIAIRARGTYTEAEMDWKSWWDNNTFDKAVVTLTSYPPFVSGNVRPYSYMSGSFTFTNVKQIGGVIQREHNEVAQDGDTVLVKAGTYLESVKIDKSITLKGEDGRDVTFIELQPTGPTYLGGLQIDGDTVTVDGFTIVGFDHTASGSGLASSNILVTNGATGPVGPSTIKILNNRIKVGQIGPNANGDDGIGIITYYTTTTDEFIDSLLVDNNEIMPLNAAAFRAFYINPGVVDFTFQNNSITGKFDATSITQAQNGLVKNNTVTGVGTPGSRSRGLGTWGYPDATVWGHTTFTGNTITNTSRAIGIFESNNVVVEKNYLDDNDTAVEVVDLGSTAFDNTTNRVNRNSITGNDTQGIKNGVAALLDGNCNWWGAANGPSGVAAGSGDAVSSNVDFTTWLLNSNLDGDCFEPPTCEGSLLCYVDDNGDDANDGLTPATAKKTIQAGIDAVAAGGEVRVLPGTYSETASGRTLTTGGTYQFGLFFADSKPGVKVIGVTAADVEITNPASVLATINTNANNGFGPSGIFVEGDDVEIRGVKIGTNSFGLNKTIEVIGDNFKLLNSHVADPEGSVYINDFRFDVGTNTSRVQSYEIDNNIFDGGVSIDLASGAGFSGAVSSRKITDNVFADNSGFWPVISFNGSDTGVPWFVYSVGGAVITGNTFGTGEQYIRARGTYDNTQFDWESYWYDNTYEKAAVTVTSFPPFGDVRTYSYTSGSYTFNDVRRIGGIIQQQEDIAQDGDTVLVKAGTYPEQVVVDKDITLLGENGEDNTFIVPPSALVKEHDAGGLNVISLVTVKDSTTANMEGFTVDGPMTGAGGCADLMTGIYVYQNSTANLKALTVRDIYLNPKPGLFGCQAGLGIRAGQYSGGSAGIVNTDDVEVFGYQKGGIVISGANSGGMIKNSFVTGEGNTNQIAQNGIQVSSGATATIDNVEVQDNRCDHATCGSDYLTETFATGILIFNSPNVVVKNSDITANDTGVYNYGTATIEKNNITNNRWNNVFLDEGEATVKANTITGGNYGVLAVAFDEQLYGITGDSKGTLTYNIISGAAIAGIFLDDEDNSNTYKPVIKANRNSIINPGDGFTNTTSNMMDGECNWWGAANGPSGVAAGSGDAVSSNVDFLPWLLSANLDGDCFGGLTDKLTVYKYNDKNNDGDQDGGEGGIQGWGIKVFNKGDDPNTATPVASGMTDASGNYMVDLPYGDYLVCEENRAGWTNTDPGMLCQEVSIPGAAFAEIPGSDPVEVSTGNGDTFIIEFLGTSNGGKTWSYKVTETGEKSLSHWVLGVCEKPLSATGPNEELTLFGTDPTTGVTGTKWDLPDDYDGEDDDNTDSATFSVTFDEAYGAKNITVAVKSGGQQSGQTGTGTVIGPDCEPREGEPVTFGNYEIPRPVVKLGLTAECRVGDLLYWRVTGDDETNDVNFTWAEYGGDENGSGQVDANTKYYFTTTVPAKTVVITWFNPATGKNESKPQAHNNAPCVGHVTFAKQWNGAAAPDLDGAVLLTAESSIATATCTSDNGALTCVYKKKSNNSVIADLEVPFGESYSVTETAPFGWQAISGVGSGFEVIDGFVLADLPNALNYDVADDRYCVTDANAAFPKNLLKYCTHTVVNELEKGSIKVVKDAVPNDAQDFTFEFRPGTGTFKLDDDSNNTLPNHKLFSDLTAGDYTIRERNIPQTWKLVGATCELANGGAANYSFDPQNGKVTVTLAPGQDVVCTFTNEKLEVPPACPATQYNQVIDWKQGTRKDGSPVLAERSNPDLAEGFAQNNDTLNFFTLGFGGYAVIEFNPAQGVVFNGPGNDVRIVETSFGDFDDPWTDYPESVKVEASQDGVTWVVIGNTSDKDQSYDLGALPWARYFRLTDTSDKSKFGATDDGFDIDAVEGIHCGPLRKITIQKVSGEPGFDANVTFTGDLPDVNGDADGDFAINGNGGMYTFENLTPGEYNVTELVPTDWTLTKVTCNQEEQPIVNNGVLIDVNEGDATCTFNNTYTPRPGKIVVTKDIIGDGTGTFTICVGNICQVFNGEETKSFDVAPGTYTVSEQEAGDDWNEPANQEVTVAPGETKEITVTNTYVPPKGKIVVVKDVVGGTDAQDFDFNVYDLGASSHLAMFSLDDDADATLSNMWMQEVNPGSFAVSETPLLDWSVAVECVSDVAGKVGTATIDPNTNGSGMAFEVADDETVTCTFKNTYTPRPAYIEVTKDIVGDATATFTICVGNDCRQFNGEGTQTWTVEAGTYTVSEQDAGPDWTEPASQQVTVKPGETAKVTVINKYTPRPAYIKVTKDIIGDKTGTFTICVNNDCRQFNGEGTQTWEVAAGTYTVSEQDAGDNWLEPASQQVTVKPGETKEVTVTNTYVPSKSYIRVTKDIVGDATGTFTICVNNDCRQFNGEGTQTFEVAAGTYTVSEQDAGPNWTEPAAQQVTVAEGETKDVTVVNTYVPPVLCPSLDPYAHLSAVIEPTGNPNEWRARIFNTSDCKYDVGFAAYKKPDNNNANQVLHSSDTRLQIMKGETIITLTVPQCAVQLDVFFDASHLGVYNTYAGQQTQLDQAPLVLPAFATGLYGPYGNWYGPRLLAFKHVHGPFCVEQPAEPLAVQEPVAQEPVVLDDDQDGVNNATDACPATAAGIAVDAAGCEIPAAPQSAEVPAEVPAQEPAAPAEVPAEVPAESTQEASNG